MRFSALASLLFASAVVAGPPPALTLREVASGLNTATAIAFPPDGSGRMVVTQQNGVARVVRNGVALDPPYVDLRDTVSGGPEQGLLGIAFHPRYRDNRRVFLYYTQLDGSLRLSEFAPRSQGDEVLDRGSERAILTIAHPTFANHNGGQIAFGPDGYLYIGVGDGGSGGDPPNNAQTLSTMLGKILRIDVDGARPYAVPPDNPFVGNSDARPEIWMYGLRNPWRFSFDRMTGDLFIGDVGQSAREEVDFARHGTRGLNFGWHVFEGLSCYQPPSGCALADHTPPVLQYGHDAAGGDSITGGFIYRGVRSASLRGFYLYGDFASNRLWAATREGEGWASYLVTAGGELQGISTFGEDEVGEIYVASYGTGRIHAIEGPLEPVNPVLRCDVASGCLPRRVPR